MNLGALAIFVIVNLRGKITGRSSLAGAVPAIWGQESTGTGWKAQSRDCGLLAGGGLGAGVGNLFEMGLETANRGESGGLYGFRL